MDPIKEIYGDFIEEVFDKTLSFCLGAEDIFLPALEYHLKHMKLSKGFRPALLLACARATGEDFDRKDMLIKALVLQLAHEASLVIDDVADHAVIRRRQRCVHCVHGRIPAGAVALFINYLALKHVAHRPPIVLALCDLALAVGRSEILQWRTRLAKRPISLETWVEIAMDNTGAMFRFAATMGGFPPNDPAIKALTLLYHGKDDCEDLVGEGVLAGGGYADLRDNVPTLPTCFTASKKAKDLRAVVPQCQEWLRQWHKVARPKEFDPFFQSLELPQID